MEIKVYNEAAMTFEKTPISCVWSDVRSELILLGVLSSENCMKFQDNGFLYLLYQKNLVDPSIMLCLQMSSFLLRTLHT